MLTLSMLQSTKAMPAQSPDKGLKEIDDSSASQLLSAAFSRHGDRSHGFSLPIAMTTRHRCGTQGPFGSVPSLSLLLPSSTEEISSSWDDVCSAVYANEAELSLGKLGYI